MTHETLIIVIIALTVIIPLAGKFWLFRFVKFKIDESAIISVVDDNALDLSNEQAIAKAAEITPERVAEVVSKSASLQSRLAN